MSDTETKWQYMVWTPSGRLSEGDLDRVGKEGWELVSVTTQPFSGPEYIFKKPLREAKS